MQRLKMEEIDSMSRIKSLTKLEFNLEKKVNLFFLPPATMENNVECCFYFHYGNLSGRKGKMN